MLSNTYTYSLLILFANKEVISWLSNDLSGCINNICMCLGKTKIKNNGDRALKVGGGGGGGASPPPPQVLHH